MNAPKLDHTLLLMVGLMVFFTGCLFGVMTFWKDDGQMFQVMSNVLSGVAGAFLRHITSDGKKKDDDGNASEKAK